MLYIIGRVPQRKRLPSQRVNHKVFQGEGKCLFQNANLSYSYQVLFFVL